MRAGHAFGSQIVVFREGRPFLQKVVAGRPPGLLLDVFGFILAAFGAIKSELDAFSKLCIFLTGSYCILSKLPEANIPLCAFEGWATVFFASCLGTCDILWDYAIWLTDNFFSMKTLKINDFA